MGAGLDRPFSVIVDVATPEDGAAFVIDGLQLDPHVERVHGAAGEEMPDVAGAHDSVDAHRLARHHRRLRPIERGDHFFGGTQRHHAARDGHRGFFTDGEGARELARLASRAELLLGLGFV